MHSTGKGDLIQPTLTHERYRFLDVLRGVALLGILPANAPFHGLPITLGQPPYAVTDSGWREPLAYYLTRFFVDYKFITIFSVLFGVGLALIHQRCAQRGISFGRLYLRRILVLAGFAAGHVVLFWMGDILSYYAVCGFLAMWAAGWSAKRLRRVGIALISVPGVFLLLTSTVLALVQDVPEVHQALQHVSQAMEPQPTPEDGFEGMPFAERLAHFGPELEIHVYAQGSFLEIAALRVMIWACGTLFFGIYFGWRILGLFMIGMSLVKSGWFVRPEADLGTFRKLGLAGLALGLPVQAMALGLASSGAGGWAGDWLAECCQYTGSLGMSATYTWLIARAFVRAKHSRLSNCLAAVGRTALSNYLLQSVFCSLLFCAYGLGMFGSLDRMQLWIVVLCIWSIALPVSPLWLRTFRFGPLEWLWRMLTYGRRIPIRREPDAPQPQ
ncbi:MAG: DUF418 domain-containing protein [Planctomycetota bacterium]|jgi:uncharacterized protein